MGAIMPPGSDVFTPGNLRHFRLDSILHTEGKLVVRSYLQTFFPGKTLKEYLDDTTVKSKLNSLLKRKKQLRTDQFDKLYPKSNQVDIKTLDISLLFLLIRCLHHNISPQDRVWTHPNPGNLSEEADVSRITSFRNRLCHPETEDLEFTETEFLFEANNLEMVITRLAKTVGNPAVDPFALAERIKAKMSGKFDPKPPQLEVAVSTTDSLGKRKKETEEQKDVAISTTSLQWTTEDDDNEKRDVATSTTSLQRKRKLSFRIKQYIDPFIIKPRASNNSPEANDTLPCKSKVRHRHSTESLANNEQHVNGSCIEFEFISKGHRRKYSRARCFRTNNHAACECRCFLAGVARLKNGTTVVTDTTHNSVQAFDKNMHLLCDIELTSPRGVCPMSDNSVIISLNKNSKLIIFKVDDVLHYVDEACISCDGWVYDVKYANDCAFVLCDKGEIHVINLTKYTEEKLCIKNKISCKMEFFDVSPSGDKIFLSDGRGVVCLVARGAELWQYRGGRSGLRTTGIVSHKERIIVAAYEENRLIELTHAGKWVREIGVNHVHSPMALSMCGGQVFVTQYMSDLNKDMCREVVCLKD